MHYLSLDLNAVISFVLFPPHLGAKYEFEYIAIGHFNFYHKSKLECGSRVVTPPPPPPPFAFLLPVIWDCCAFLFLRQCYKHFRPVIACFLLPRMIMCSEEGNEHGPFVFIPRPSASTSLRFLKPFRTLRPALPRRTQTSLQPLNPRYHLKTLPP